MQAIIITIGDELLIGQVVDTNSSFIALRLNEAGIEVAEKRTIGDNADDIKGSVTEALLKYPVTIVTGGLGPTKDDITKKTLSEIFGCGMHEDRAVYEMVKAMVDRRGIEMNELNRSQALVPDACKVLPNPNGTAPGMLFERDGHVLISLPGVPFEMESLTVNEVIPWLSARFGMADIVHRTVATIGIAESVLATRIAAWEDSLPRHVSLAYLPSMYGVRLRLSSYGHGSSAGNTANNVSEPSTDKEQCPAAVEITACFEELESIIPDHFLGYGDITVEKAVANLLTSSGKTLSIAESCTGGRICNMFTLMPGASEYLVGGVVAYTAETKVNILGVSPADIKNHGIVSREVAEQMALGIRNLTGSDYSIATTGVMGPATQKDEAPVGTVWMAIGTPAGTISRKTTLAKLRKPNIERASASAINMLRLVLTNKENSMITGGVL